MTNIVTINGKPTTSPTFGSLKRGDIFQHPAGTACYMKVEVRSGYFMAMHLGEGVVYDIDHDKQIIPITDLVTITRKPRC